MNEYYRLAAAYFKEFEPRSAFPGLNSYHWYLWVGSLALFSYFGYEYFFADIPFSKRRLWEMIVFELVFLVSCVLISIERFRRIVRATSEHSELKPIERLGISKRARLETLLGRPAWEFMATAKEIIELRDLEKACRPAAGNSLGDLWSKIYDPDSKTRLLTLITALLGLVIAVLGKNADADIIQSFANEGTWPFIKSLGLLIVMVFFTGVAVYHALRQLLELLPSLFSTLFPPLHNRQTTLDYLVRDLVEYHRMQPPIAAAVQTPLPQREPGLMAFAGALCIALLRPQSTPARTDCADVTAR